MPLGVPFKDRHGNHGDIPVTDRIDIRQWKRQKIQFVRLHDGNGYLLLLPAGTISTRMKITNRNAIRLARWILEQAELNSGKSSKAVLADEGEKH